MSAVAASISPDHGSESTPVVLQSTKLTPFIGSVVHGIDLKERLSDATIAAIRALLLERGVLFFPNQHLTPQQHLDFTARFGPVNITERPRMGSPLPGINVFDSRDQIYGRVSRWHADLTSAERPRAIAVNQAIVLPEVGGDTLWISAEAAYERLSEPLKRLAESLTAIHAITPIKTTEWGKPGLKFHWSEHPVVRVHPETGRKSLFVNPRYTPEIVGLRPHESAAVLKVFFDHLLQPEHTVRYRWSVGDIAIWDNRNTLHYAVDDYDDQVRIVHTCGVAGDRPYGVDGPGVKYAASGDQPL